MSARAVAVIRPAANIIARRAFLYILSSQGRPVARSSAIKPSGGKEHFADFTQAACSSLKRAGFREPRASMGWRPPSQFNGDFLTANKKRIGTGEPNEPYLRPINVSSTGN
jgi:hypothetical protein